MGLAMCTSSRECMSPSRRQAVKCALILVQSKLSILRAVDKHEPSLTLRVAVNKS